MPKLIPRHCLVIAIGPDDAARAKLLKHHFPKHEVLSAAQIAEELTGPTEMPGLISTVNGEVRHRIELKLRLGERVVVDGSNLRKDERVSFARIAYENGVPVFYLLVDSEKEGAANGDWRLSQKDLSRGDGIAEIIDGNAKDIYVCPRESWELDDIAARWSGITVIADVHGMQQTLMSALSWARSRNHYVVFLGDVIDYGPQTLEVADIVYSMVMREEAELMFGNHERKISRWIQQQTHGYPNVNLSEGNRVTTEALTHLSSKAFRQWTGRFTGLVANAQHVRTMGNFVFAHASIHPKFWDGSGTLREIETSALFGEFDPGRKSNTYIPRTYRWVDEVPANKIVIVGHDIRSKNHPLTVTSKHGGTTVFLDTGCGKGGMLSTCDLRFQSNGLRLTNFNFF